MMDFWTKEDIEAIMVQLNKQALPFRNYEFSGLGKGMKLLGHGASARVYEAVSRETGKEGFAIKVIGFGNKHVDSASFRAAVESRKAIAYPASDHVVKIYASTELRVWIKGENEVEKVDEFSLHEETKPVGNYLHLQFIVMEKLSPVLESNGLRHKLIPSGLLKYDEKEIMKLAREIGIAIDGAHKSKLLHRDIKLENIFYDAKARSYKLGDFGIAKTTDDGMASTVAFTKGYGAPEVVGTLDDKYDCTADIYSFGMLLYVLLNELRFPESNDYRPTVYQYAQGYVPPEPLNGSDELAAIVSKMLSFNPDDRYQSMEEVLNEFDKLKFGGIVKYQKEHKRAALAIGCVFALLGAVFFWLSFRDGAAAFSGYRWVAVLLLSLGLGLLVRYGILGIRDEKQMVFYFGKKMPLIVSLLFYVTAAFIGWTLIYAQRTYEMVIGADALQWLLSLKLHLVGICGMIFCVFWIARERFLIFLEGRSFINSH